MSRALALPALLASGGLLALLTLGRVERRYAGPLHEVDARDLTIDVLDGPADMTTGIGVMPLPATLRGRIGGTRSLEFIGLTVPTPPRGLEGAAKGMEAELRHSYLDLPWIGPVLGATTLRVGNLEWREPVAALWTLTTLLALAPALFWAAAAAAFGRSPGALRKFQG